MLFVYSTVGTKEENEWAYQKAKYDAEAWYYRGNGAVDIIADKEYNAAKYAGRNVVLYGHASSNAAYPVLLQDCPVRLDRNIAVIGAKKWEGDDKGMYFIWPVGSDQTVAVIGGTGQLGRCAANANQYFAGASGFPDIMLFDAAMLSEGAKGVLYTDFYTNTWQVKP